VGEGQRMVVGVRKCLTRVGGRHGRCRKAGRVERRVGREIPMVCRERGVGVEVGRKEGGALAIELGMGGAEVAGEGGG
jgi:hypothetical protein